MLNAIPNFQDPILNHPIASPIEFQGRRCDPNSVVGYKNYSQAWGYNVSQNGLSYKKCQFIFNNLEKRMSLNTVMFCPYEMPGCF